MAVAKSFRDLNVYRQADEAAQKIFQLSRKFPAKERYSLTDRIRRSSRAVKAMIAEAWGRRRYKAVFINKLDEALGEATETQSWLDDAYKAQYISADQFDDLDAQYITVGKMLSRMIDRADDFCKHSPATDYRGVSPRIQESPLPDGELLSLNEFFA